MPEDASSPFGDTRKKRIWALTAAVVFFAFQCVHLVVDFAGATKIVGYKSLGPLAAVVDPIGLVVCAALLRGELRAGRSRDG